MSQVNEYIADGTRTTFAYRFPAFELADLQVQIDGVSQFGGFAVYGLGGGNGGAVEFAAAPAIGAAIRIARVKVPPQVAYLVKDENLADVDDKAAARTNLGVYSTLQTDAAISTAATSVSDAALLKAQNLLDVPDKGAARTNLGVYSTVQTDAAITAAATSVSDAALLKAQNLFDVPDKAAARTNLGVYSTLQTDAVISTAATQVSDAALLKAQNLFDVPDKGAARTNLGVYSTIQTDAAISTAATSVSDAALLKAQNLFDVPNKATARNNLEIYSITQTDAAISTATALVSDAALLKEQNLFDVPNKATARTNLGVPSTAEMNDVVAALDVTLTDRVATLERNLALTVLRSQMAVGWPMMKVVDGIADEFEDETGIATKTGATYDSTGDYYHSPTGNGLPYTGTSVVTGTFYKDGNIYATTPGGSYDTNTATNWILYNGTNGTVTFGWLLGAGCPLSKIDAHVGASYPIKNCTVQVSTDTTDGTNGTWSTVVTGWSPTPNQYTSLTIPNGTYRGLRITSGTTYSNYPSAYYAEVGEIRFYGIMSASNMTLVSVVNSASGFTMAAPPAEARLVVLHQPVEAVALNTDLIAEVSRDGGSNWAAAPLVDEGGLDGTNRVLAATANLSATPAGTSMVWRLRTLNNKEQRLHGVWLQWR